MATKQSKKANQNEVLENPEVLAERIGRGEAFLKKNSKILGGVIAAAIVLIGGILFFQINNQNQNEKAQAEMFQAVYFFEQDSVDFAIIENETFFFFQIFKSQIEFILLKKTMNSQTKYHLKK